MTAQVGAIDPFGFAQGRLSIDQAVRVRAIHLNESGGSGEWSRRDASDIDGRAFLAERAGASESTAPTK